MTRTLYAEFTARPGEELRVAELIRGLAEQVRAEPGNVLFDVYTVESAPRCFFVLEVYRDKAAFAEHLAAEYGAVFNVALGPLIEEDASVLTFLEPLG
jgi:quinol monooxygenase YgiN